MPDWKVTFADGTVRVVRGLPNITAARHTALAIAYGHGVVNPVVQMVEPVLPQRTI